MVVIGLTYLQTQITNDVGQVSRLVNIDYNGKDLPYRNKIVNGFQECVNYCRTVPMCKYWTYNTAIRRCYLKYDDWNRKVLSDHISGNINCLAGK